MKFMFGLQHLLTCKPWTTLSNLTNKVRGEYVVKKSFCVFFPASFIRASIFLRASVFIIIKSLWYGKWVCNTWMLTKRLEKKLDVNYTRMLQAILYKFWRQHPTRHQLYGHLPPITKIIQVRRTRLVRHCWRNRDELISDVLLWTPTKGRSKAGRPARTYIQQLCKDTGYSPEVLPEAMNDREKWRVMVRDNHAGGMTWWWWFSYALTYI